MACTTQNCAASAESDSPEPLNRGRPVLVAHSRADTAEAAQDHEADSATRSVQRLRTQRGWAIRCRARAQPHPETGRYRNKHLKIDQNKLDRAKRVLKLPTEQATIDRALDAILVDESIVRAHRRLRGLGGVVAAFEDE